MGPGSSCVLTFLILFHAFEKFSCFGWVKLCQYIKETNGDGVVCLAGQSTNWHPYQIGGISLLAINCPLILMEDTITKWSSVRFLHETIYTRIL